MYMLINHLGYSCMKKIQRDNLLHAYNEPINIYSVPINRLLSMPLMKAKSFWFSKLKKLKITDIPLSNFTINYKGKNQINFQHKPATATKKLFIQTLQT